MKGRDLLMSLFALATFLLTWPFLTVFNRPALVLGVPVLVLYLFGVWAAIIGVLFWLSRRRPPSPGSP